MTRLEIILSLIMSVSILMNIGLVAYVRAVLASLLFVSEELGDLQDMIDSFAKHVKRVYELDMFYGDQTLQALMEHAVSLNEQLGTFEHIYSLTTEDQIQQEEEEFEDADNQEIEEKD